MKIICNIFLLWAAVIFISACTKKDKHVHHDAGVTAYGTNFTCPMHPQIVESEPGSCPVCGMSLVAVKNQTSNEENNRSIMLSQTQMRLGNITTQPVIKGKVYNNTVLTGRLVLDQTQTDLISSRASGRIERLYVKETGQTIRKGQPLYNLYSETLLTLEQEYLLALDQVKAFPAEKQFKSILDAAKNKLKLIGLSNRQINRVAQTRQSDATVTFLAPTSGTVTEIAAVEGVYVREGSPLYRTSRLNNIWVEAELFSGEAANLKIGTPIQVTVPGLAGEIKTNISFLNPEFRQNSQVVVARAAISNQKGRLIPGTQASISLPGVNNSGIVVPLEAVIREARGAHVWVKTGKNTFKAQPVSLGAESAQQVAIQKGLTNQDTIVVTGAYLLYSEYVLKNGPEQMIEQNQ